jgi:hypothetical protein
MPDCVARPGLYFLSLSASHSCLIYYLRRTSCPLPILFLTLFDLSGSRLVSMILATLIRLVLIRPKSFFRVLTCIIVTFLAVHLVHVSFFYLTSRRTSLSSVVYKCR